MNKRLLSAQSRFSHCPGLGSRPHGGFAHRPASLPGKCDF
jgi:hypothetical protein